MLAVPEKIFAMTWIIGLSVVLTLGCIPKPAKSILVPKFEKGEIVESVLTGERLMVMRVYNYPPEIEYKCRIGNALSVNRDGLLSRDTVDSRYALKRFDEFELRKAKKE